MIIKNDKELIEKLQELRQIKPKKDWALFAKNEILSSEVKENKSFSLNTVIADIFLATRFALGHKFAFSGLLVFLVLAGMFGFSLKSEPGDRFFILKKSIEDSQTLLMSREDKISFNLEKASKRLGELTIIVEENKIEKLDLIINDYKASVSEVAKNLIDENDNKKIKDVVASVKKLEDDEELIKSLGIELGENPDKDLALVKLISKQVEELEKRDDLSSENVKKLEQVKSFSEKGYFTEALELILVINNNSH